jgi:hypothetical protein
MDERYVKKYYEHIYKTVTMNMTTHLHRPKNIVDTIYDFFDDFFDDLGRLFFQNGVKKCPKCRQKNVLSYPVTFCQKCSTQYRDVPQPSITEYRYRKQSIHASNYRKLNRG